jgi:hypothetical protein
VLFAAGVGEEGPPAQAVSSASNRSNVSERKKQVWRETFVANMGLLYLLADEDHAAGQPAILAELRAGRAPLTGAMSRFLSASIPPR